MCNELQNLDLHPSKQRRNSCHAKRNACCLKQRKYYLLSTIENVACRLLEMFGELLAWRKKWKLRKH
jgi:hypothetical protein